jgi:hypothetical protein
MRLFNIDLKGCQCKVRLFLAQSSWSQTPIANPYFGLITITESWWPFPSSSVTGARHSFFDVGARPHLHVEAQFRLDLIRLSCWRSNLLAAIG